MKRPLGGRVLLLLYRGQAPRHQRTETGLQRHSRGGRGTCLFLAGETTTAALREAPRLHITGPHLPQTPSDQNHRTSRHESNGFLLNALNTSEERLKLFQ